MTATLLLAQLLNGLQYGVLLFLLAAGLTLVFGIMSFVNLAHGSLYMVGAYAGALAYGATGSFALALAAAMGAALLLGLLLEVTIVSRLYRRDHLDHVLATFGLVMFFNELVRIIWGPQPLFVEVPAVLGGTVDLLGLSYPAYRFAIIAAGLVVAVGSWWLIHKTRVGMLIRAGAQNPQLVGALGVNIGLLNAMLFGAGAMHVIRCLLCDFLWTLESSRASCRKSIHRIEPQRTRRAQSGKSIVGVVRTERHRRLSSLLSPIEPALFLFMRRTGMDSQEIAEKAEKTRACHELPDAAP